MLSNPTNPKILELELLQISHCKATQRAKQIHSTFYKMTALTSPQEKGTIDREQHATLYHVLHIVHGLLDTGPLVKAIKLNGCEHI